MKTVIINEREYPIRLSINAVDQIQKRYGSMQAIAEKIIDYSEVTWLLSLLINEGLKYRLYDTGERYTPVTGDQIGCLLDFKGLGDADFSQAIVDAINESTGAEKNLEAEDLMRMMRNGELTQKK